MLPLLVKQKDAVYSVFSRRKQLDMNPTAVLECSYYKIVLLVLIWHQESLKTEDGERTSEFVCSAPEFQALITCFDLVRSTFLSFLQSFDGGNLVLPSSINRHTFLSLQLIGLSYQSSSLTLLHAKYISNNNNSNSSNSTESLALELFPQPAMNGRFVPFYSFSCFRISLWCSG